MNCREFLIIFEERGDLNEAAVLHLKICRDCEKVRREQTHVWQMIDNLPRVDAPQNFDFLVKAGIANAEPKDFQPRLFPVLRYVLPLCAIVLLTGLIVYKTNLFSGRETAQTIQPTPAEKIIQPDNLPQSKQIAADVNPEKSPSNFSDANVEPLKIKNETPLVAEKTTPRTPNVKENVKDNFNGSRTSAVTSAQVINPRGTNSNRVVEAMPNDDTQISKTAEDILRQLGIETVSENEKRKVNTVKQDSIGERSGVKIGDIIEAIDGKKISSEPIRGTSIEGKSITVMRGAEKILITLQNKTN